MYMCDVCGYPRLRRPARDHIICPSCGTEFGLDDADPGAAPVDIKARLRSQWIDHGMRWFSRVTHAPMNWNGYAQLVAARLIPETYAVAGSVVSHVPALSKTSVRAKRHTYAVTSKKVDVLNAETFGVFTLREGHNLAG